jgi:hypothetical protein
VLSLDGARLAAWLACAQCGLPDRMHVVGHLLRGNGPVVRYARCCLQQADRRSWAAALEVIAGYDGSDRLAAISVPVMLVAAMAQPGPAPGCLMH